jgi:hypothetical protein
MIVGIIEEYQCFKIKEAGKKKIAIKFLGKW